MLLSFDTTPGSTSSQIQVQHSEFEMPEIDKPSSITNDIFLTENVYEGPNEMEIDWVSRPLCLAYLSLTVNLGFVGFIHRRRKLR